MAYLAAVVHVLTSRMRDHVEDVRDSVRSDSDRGSETIEKVLWAVAVIGLVTVVVGVMKAYVESKSGEIK